MDSSRRPTLDQNRILRETSRTLVEHARELIEKSKTLSRTVVAKQPPGPNGRSRQPHSVEAEGGKES